MSRGGPEHRRPRVLVLFGGRSEEHSISCVTAGGVLGAVDRDRYDVIPVGIARSGRWVRMPDDPGRLAIRDGILPEVDDTAPAVLLPVDPTDNELLISDGGHTSRLGPVDVVLPLLHGPYGEDGTVQGMLELAGIRYVGSGVLASALGMDKGFLKHTLVHADLPVCRSVAFTAGEWKTAAAELSEAVAGLGWPVFVKPCRAGSSVGISRVTQPGDLGQAVVAAAAHDPRLLVEEMVVGREIECGVLESPSGSRPDTSVLGEIVVDDSHEFYDFEAKYLDEASVSLLVPAEVEPTVAAAMQDTAARAYRALACEGLARVDFFLREDGSFVINEVNTMPGFTPFSMFPRLWQATGVDYPALVDRLLQSALSRPIGLR
jgi:D-alanine-D-alanine ligase